MGCGGSAPKNQEPSDKKYEKKGGTESKPTEKGKGGDSKVPPVAPGKVGSPKEGALGESPPGSPRDKVCPQTIVHGEHRLECKFGDVELEHRLGLWQIIRGQDTIERGPPEVRENQCRVVIRTDFGGDINLVLTEEEARKVRVMKAKEDLLLREKSTKKKKKKKKGDGPESPDHKPDQDEIHPRELLVSRASKDRELMGLRVEALRGHPKGVKVAMLSPNDWLLVTSDNAAAGTECNPARCTDIRTGLMVGGLDGRRKRCFDPIAGAAFSTDGQQLATIHRTDQMLLWDMNTFRVKKEMSIADDVDTEMRLVGVAMSPDMKLIACAAAQFNDDGEGIGRVPVYDSGGKQVFMFRDHEGPVTTVAFSPNSLNIASGAEDGGLFLWEARTGTVVRSFEGHTAGIKTVTFAPDGLTLYSLDEQCLTAWNTENGECRWTRPIDGAPVVGKTATEVKGDATSPRSPGSGSPRVRMRFTTVSIAANGVGFLGMVDRRVTVFDIDTGEEVDSVTTKAPVTAMSAGCRSIALGDMWGNIYLVHIF